MLTRTDPQRAAQALREPPASPAAPARPSLPTGEPAAPKPQQNAALRLLQFEAEIRRQGDDASVQFHIANRVQDLVSCDQILVCRYARAPKRWRITCISGLPTVDGHVSLIRAYTSRLNLLRAQLPKAHSFDLQLLPSPGRKPSASDELLARQAAHFAHWEPLPDRHGEIEAGVLFLREKPFSPGEVTLLHRLGDTYAHAWAAIPVRRRLGTDGLFSRTRLAVTVAVLTVIGLIPVRQSVMGAVEVVSADPALVTAPISGVVKDVLVAPNQAVHPGDVLVQFEDIQPRNEAVLTQQRMAVAQTRFEKLNTQAFTDPQAAHDLATARAEYELAIVNHDYALEVLRRTQVVATTEGVAVYADRRDWQGRAVQVGEELMQVADPRRIAYRVDLSAGNTLPLVPGAEAMVYLDTAPLGGYAGKVQRVNYAPRYQPGGDATYTVMLDAEAGAVPRIGARGTARLYGETRPLVVQLLRRPWAAVRQSLGL